MFKLPSWLPARTSHRHSLFAAAWASATLLLDLQPHMLSWVSGGALLVAAAGHVVHGAIAAHKGD